MNMGQVDFGTLKASAKIFEVLESGRYPWWDTLKNERQFYCEVRKDNQVNVYFEGGSVAPQRSRGYQTTHRRCYRGFLAYM